MLLSSDYKIEKANILYEIIAIVVKYQPLNRELTFMKIIKKILRSKSLGLVLVKP